MKTNEGFQRRLKSIDGSISRTGLSDKMRFLDEFILRPMLSDLIQATGLLHNTVLGGYSVEIDGRWHQCYNGIYLQRKRPNTHGFWNWWARFFAEYQEVLRITWNGQMFVCQYSISYYFMTAQSIRDEYYEKLQEAFGGYDFVIVGAD